ncbi:murein transglycosylase [Escherichia sp. E4385]|nr:murein transglycosylase [Escherichia sp. E4385]
MDAHYTPLAFSCNLFFYSDHGFGMILNKNKALKSIFCAKFASGNTTDFIKGDGLLSSLTPYFLT